MGRVITGMKVSSGASASLPGRWGDAIEMIVKKKVILRRFESKGEGSETLLQILCAKNNILYKQRR